MKNLKKGFSVWFTGISGAGKTTLAYHVATELRSAGYENIEVLDENIIEKYLGHDGRGQPVDRNLLTRRIGFIADLLTFKGTIVFVAAVSHDKEAREEIYRRHRAPFLLAHLDRSPFDILISRSKRFFHEDAFQSFVKRVESDERQYEKPENPDIYIPRQDIEDATRLVFQKLKELLDFHVPCNPGLSTYTPKRLVV